MKNAVLLFVTVLLSVLCLSSCTKENGNVRVRFINASAHELTGITVQNTAVGNLKPGARSHWVRFEHLSFDGSMCAETIEVAKDGVVIRDEYASFCATGFYRKTEGRYEIGIHVWENTYGTPLVSCRLAN